MFAYFAVYMYDGVVEEVRAFATVEAARKYFHEVIEANGKVEDCDSLFYNDGDNGYFYWSCCYGYCEITIQKVEIE